MATTDPPTTGIVAFGRRYPLVPVALGVCLYSTGPVIVSASDVSGPVFSFFRLWMGVGVFGLLTLGYLRVGGRRPDRAGWAWAVRGGVAFGLHQLCFMTAVKATSVVDVTLMSTISPIIIGAIAVPMFGERPGRTFRLWSLVAMAGAAAVVVAGSTGTEGRPLGMFLAFLNVCFFAWFFVFSKRGREHIDVVPFLFGVMTIAALTVSVFVLLAREPVATVDARSLWLAAALACGPGALGHFVMTWPLRWVPANVPPVMRLAQPFIAGALAWYFLGQPVGVGPVVGGAVTIGGVAGALLSPSGRRFARAPAGSPLPDTG